MKTDDLLRKFASIVFVHGLTGNRETTWTHKEAKVFWPQAFLARDLPNTRILTFGYCPLPPYGWLQHTEGQWQVAGSRFSSAVDEVSN